MSEYTLEDAGMAMMVCKDGNEIDAQDVVILLNELQGKVEELEMALQGFVDDSRGVYVRSGGLVITTCESREIAIEALNSIKETTRAEADTSTIATDGN